MDFLDTGDSIAEIGEDGYINHISKYHFKPSLQLSHTLAAHFDGDEYTDEELEEIKCFAEYVKSKRKDQD